MPNPSCVHPSHIHQHSHTFRSIATSCFWLGYISRVLKILETVCENHSRLHLSSPGEFKKLKRWASSRQLQESNQINIRTSSMCSYTAASISNLNQTLNYSTRRVETEAGENWFFILLCEILRFFLVGHSRHPSSYVRVQGKTQWLWDSAKKVSVKLERKYN